MRRLNLSLNKNKDFDKVIKALQEYKESLDNKAQLIVSKLADIGIKAVNVQVGSISPFYKGEDLRTDKDLIMTENGWTAIISMSGSQALFIEFGAGVTFNTSKGSSLHPVGEELGYTIGSYNPSSPHATDPNGWWYMDQWGEWQHTYGTPTFAPMYNSSLVMLTEIQKVAKEVFSNG